MNKRRKIMKKGNKIFKKVLSIVLVCVMLVTSMGAYSGDVVEEVAENEQKQEFTVYQNVEGIYTQKEKIGSFNNNPQSKSVIIHQAEDSDVIYVDKSGNYYQEIQKNTFSPVEKLEYGLNSSNTLNELASLGLPEEILLDIEETITWSKEEGMEDAGIVVYASAEGLVTTYSAIKNGIDIKVYEIRFKGLDTNYIPIVSQKSFAEAALRTIVEIAAVGDPTMVTSIFSSFDNAGAAWESAFGYAEVNFNSQNALTIKLNYEMSVKYGYVEMTHLGHTLMAHTTTLSSIDLSRIESYYTYFSTQTQGENARYVRYVDEQYKSYYYEDAIQQTYDRRGLNDRHLYDYVGDLYVALKISGFPRKVKFGIEPPAYDRPDEWGDAT